MGADEKYMMQYLEMRDKMKVDESILTKYLLEEIGKEAVRKWNRKR